MGLQGLERRLERMVEGVFARAFRSSLRPIELGRRLVREMDDHRTVDVRGKVLVPNTFTFRLSQADQQQFASIHDHLVQELCDAAREYARDEGYSFMGPVTVELQTDAAQRAGRFVLQSGFAEGPGGAGAGALVLPSGQRYLLGEHVVDIGRLPDCAISVADPNVSRRHAEIRPSGSGYVVIDLGSTNGTKVNGVTVKEHRLADGDEVTIGATRVRFEAS